MLKTWEKLSKREVNIKDYVKLSLMGKGRIVYKEIQLSAKAVKMKNLISLKYKDPITEIREIPRFEIYKQRNLPGLNEMLDNSLKLDIKGPKIDAGLDIKGPKLDVPGLDIKGPKIDGPGLDINGQKIDEGIRLPNICGPIIDIKETSINPKTLDINLPSKCLPKADMNIQGPKIVDQE